MRPPEHPAEDDEDQDRHDDVPITPSGSRTKILISSQVSFQSPRSMAPQSRIEWPVSLQEHVLERRRSVRKSVTRIRARRGSG